MVLMQEEETKAPEEETEEGMGMETPETGTEEEAEGGEEMGGEETEEDEGEAEM